MLESLRPALVITRREVRDQLRDWRIIFPIVILTLVFPFLANFAAAQMLNFVTKYGADIIGERLVPFLMMIVGFFPISVSLVMALETFVGERERGSIEPLLNTPLKDWQLYLGKLLAATVPPLVASYLGMGVYTGGLLLQGIPLPEINILLQVLVLTSAQAVMMVSGAVVVSSQTTSVRAANLLSSFIVIPTAFLIQGESVMMFWGTNDTLWYAVIGVVVLAVLLVRVGLANFRREELLGRDIDVLNVKWGWRVFKAQFTGGARTPWAWYAKSVGPTLRKMRKAILLAAVIGLVGVVVGYFQIERFNLPITETSLKEMDSRISQLVQMWPLFSFGPVLYIFWHNVRTLLLGMVLGLVSFSILGMIPLFGTTGVIGYLMALLSTNGLPVWNYAMFILPHGVLEIPALVLASAAVLQSGAILATPSPGKSIGQTWLESLADWCKVMVGLVVPALLVAAMIEAWFTPRIAALFF
ncbi:MAG: stage II sporulation protein M [Anaerolineaceae bacterium]|nr:stage II sporulation protein M [Anaerolineaceae bacterium]